jgi:hypothetical protein
VSEGLKNEKDEKKIDEFNGLKTFSDDSSVSHSS